MAILWILINVMCTVSIRGHEANFYEAEARCHEAEIEAEAGPRGLNIPGKPQSRLEFTSRSEHFWRFDLNYKDSIQKIAILFEIWPWNIYGIWRKMGTWDLYVWFKSIYKTIWDLS